MNTHQSNPPVPRISILALLFLALLGTLASHAASPPPLTDLGTLGGSYSYSAGINDLGQVAGGAAIAGDAADHAFLWDQTNGMRDLGTIGAFPGSYAIGLNGRGQVFGELYDESGFFGTHGFFWDPLLGMQDLGTLGGEVHPQAMNDSGQIVGWARRPDNAMRAFIWDKTLGMRDLGSLGGNNSQALAISASGQVVGWADTSAQSPENPHAFLWDATRGMQNLGTLGSDSSIARGINDFGEVAGDSQTALGLNHAFRWDAAHGMRDLGTLGGNQSYGVGINNYGQVIGESDTPRELHAFIWDPAHDMREITLGGTFSTPAANDYRGLNDAGQVVGRAQVMTQVHAFVWSPNGGTVDLGTLGGVESYAWGINSFGQVVGDSYTSDGGYHAFFAALPPPPVQGEPFIGLDVLPGQQYSIPFAASENALCVFGGSGTSRVGDWLWRWTPRNGLENIGGGCCGHAPDLSLDDPVNTAKVSPDGKILLVQTGNGQSSAVARWSESDGFTFVDTIPAPEPSGDPRDNRLRFASRDRQIFVGISFDEGFENDWEDSQSVPWRWTPAGGLVSIGLPPGAVSSEITGLSESGDVVCGYAWFRSSGLRLPWRWTAAEGLTLLNNDEYSWSTGISADGKVIMGRENIGAWRWTAETGLVRLDIPAGWDEIEPRLISGNGTAIAGWATRNLPNPNGQGTFPEVKAWRWTEDTGSVVLGILPDYQIVLSARISDDGRVIVGTGLSQGNDPARFPGLGEVPWRWSSETGTTLIGSPGTYATGIPQVQGMSADGSVLAGYDLISGRPQNAWRWTSESGLRRVTDQFQASPGWNPGYPMLLSRDGSVAAGGASSPDHLDGEPWIAAYAPVISSISPESIQAGSAGFDLSIYGLDLGGVTALWNGQELLTLSLRPTEIRARIPETLLQSAADLTTVTIQLRGPNGELSNAKGLTILRDTGNVAAVENAIVQPGSPATVSIPPADESSGALTATLEHEGDASATLTVAAYNENPSPGPATFEVTGGYVDLNVSGATLSDSLDAFFYYPAGSDAGSLKFYNQAAAAWEDVSPVINNTAEHRFEVRFDASSHPRVTELGGTFFAPALLPPVIFSGFLPPVGGADASGGTSSNPLRTFKLGSTIPVKFTLTQEGAPLLTGVHTLEIIKFSSATTDGVPVLVTSQDAATIGSQFRVADSEWQFTLSTKSLSVGIFKLTARLSSGAEHSVWIQLK